jgi:hypothetical protein
MANNLGSLVVSLGLDAAEFTRGMSKSEYQAKQSSARIKGEFNSLLKFVGGLGISALFVQNIRSAADFADEMGKTAQRVGATSVEYSKLSYAASLADVSNQELSKGLVELSKDIGDGGKRLSEFGIGITDATGKAKSGDQVFREVADRFASMPDGVDKTSAAVKLFGDRVGPQLIPLLNAGSAGLREMGDEAERFGRVVKEDAAKQAEAFNDNMTRLSTLAQSAGYSIANSLIPSLARLSSEFLTGLRHANGLLDAIFTFGTAGAFDRPADGAKKYREELGRLQAAREKLIDAEGVTANTSGFDRDIETAKKRLAYFNDLHRQTIEFNQDDQSGAEARRLGIRPPTFVPRDPATTPKTPKPKGGLTTAQKEAAQAEKDYQALLSSYAEAEDQNRQALFTKRLDDERRAEQAHADWLKSMDEDAAEYRQKLFADRLEAEDKALAKSIEDAAKASEDQARRLGDAFSSTFDNAFKQGQSFGDLLKKLAYDAINIQLLTPAVQKAGSALGSIFTGIFGGARAGGGSVSAGTTYLVGEKGPELWTAPANGNIIPNNALGSMGGPSITFAPVIDARGSQAGVENLIDAKLRQAEARFRATIVPTVMAAANRGGGAARALGRA